MIKTTSCLKTSDFPQTSHHLTTKSCPATTMIQLLQTWSRNQTFSRIFHSHIVLQKQN